MPPAAPGQAGGGRQGFYFCAEQRIVPGGDALSSQGSVNPGSVTGPPSRMAAAPEPSWWLPQKMNGFLKFA